MKTLFQIFKGDSPKKQPTITESEALKKIHSLLNQQGEPPTLIYKGVDGYISTTDLSSLGGKNPSIIHPVVIAMGPLADDPRYASGWILAGAAYGKETFDQLIEKVKNGSIKIVVHNSPDERTIQVFE